MTNFLLLLFYSSGFSLSVPRHEEPQAAQLAEGADYMVLPFNVTEQILLTVGIGISLVLLASLLTTVRDQFEN